MSVRTYTATLVLSGTAAGTAGFGNVPTLTSAVGVPVNGLLVGIQIQFTPTMTGGTATIATLGQGGPAGTLLNYVGGTSQWFYPQAVVQTTGGTATTFYQVMPVDDQVNIVVTGGSAGTVVAKMLMAQ
jgi:hypothetical protein